jgi:hypothetical protein
MSSPACNLSKLLPLLRLSEDSSTMVPVVLGENGEAVLGEGPVGADLLSASGGAYVPLFVPPAGSELYDMINTYMTQARSEAGAAVAHSKMEREDADARAEASQLWAEQSVLGLLSALFGREQKAAESEARPEALSFARTFGSEQSRGASAAKASMLALVAGSLSGSALGDPNAVALTVAQCLLDPLLHTVAAMRGTERYALFRSSVGRREALSRWLQEQAVIGNGAAASPFESVADMPVNKRIIAALLRRDLQTAADLALQSRQARLALLLSQASTEPGVRALVEAQYLQWVSGSGPDGMPLSASIDSDLLSIYRILSGRVVVPAVTDGEGPLPQPLSWKESLALHHWYGEQPQATVLQSLESYRVAAADNAASVAVPWYLGKASLGSKGLVALPVSFDGGARPAAVDLAPVLSAKDERSLYARELRATVMAAEDIGKRKAVGGFPAIEPGWNAAETQLPQGIPARAQAEEHPDQPLDAQDGASPDDFLVAVEAAENSLHWAIAQRKVTAFIEGPLPSGLVRTDATGAAVLPRRDTAYQLLRLACAPESVPLWSVVAPEGYSPDGADMHLGWHLHCLLSTIGSERHRLLLLAEADENQARARAAIERAVERLAADGLPRPSAADVDALVALLAVEHDDAVVGAQSSLSASMIASMDEGERAGRAGSQLPPRIEPLEPAFFARLALGYMQQLEHACAAEADAVSIPGWAHAVFVALQAAGHCAFHTRADGSDDLRGWQGSTTRFIREARSIINRNVPGHIALRDLDTHAGAAFHRAATWLMQVARVPELWLVHAIAQRAVADSAEALAIPALVSLVTAPLAKLQAVFGTDARHIHRWAVRALQAVIEHALAPRMLPLLATALLGRDAAARSGLPDPLALAFSAVYCEIWPDMCLSATGSVAAPPVAPFTVQSLVEALGLLNVLHGAVGLPGWADRHGQLMLHFMQFLAQLQQGRAVNAAETVRRLSQQASLVLTTHYKRGFEDVLMSTANASAWPLSPAAARSIYSWLDILSNLA